MRLIARGALGSIALLAVVRLPASSQGVASAALSAQLAEACKNGDNSAVESLLKEGADVNAESDVGVPLMWAAQAGHLDTVQLLVHHGAKIDGRNHYGATALMWAAEQERRNVVEFLLSQGADVKVKDTWGDTPVIKGTGSPAIEKLLLDHGAAIDPIDDHGFSALMWAASQGRAETVAFLLDRGANPDSRDKDGNTALHEAAFLDHTRIVNLLLDRGFKIDVRNSHGQTPLMKAASFGSINAVRLLLKRGSDARARDHEGKTASALICTGILVRGQCSQKRIAQLRRALQADPSK